MMGEFTVALSSLEADFKAADDLVDEIYNKYFNTYFQQEMELYSKFNTTDVPIADSELEWIITSLPLELFSVSGALAQFKQHNEIVKLKIKQRKSTEPDEDMTDEYKLLSIVYSSVITRVEQQISSSRELIMGAKKVWDARRSSETPPIHERVAPDLPDYPMCAKSESYQLPTGTSDRVDF